MSVAIFQVMVGGSISAAAMYFQADRGRNMAIGHKVELRKMIRRYRQDAANQKGTGNEVSTKFADIRLAEDEAWYSREVKILDDWLARPFYRQLGFVPFPDYGNDK